MILEPYFLFLFIYLFFVKLCQKGSVDRTEGVLS